MQHFLVAVFLVTISGLLQETNGCDSEINKTGNFSGDVDLPCNCSISLNSEEFKWQKDQKKPVCKFINQLIQPFEGYENRLNHTPSETKGYCSIWLKNITEADNGTYECSFKVNGEYKKHCVNLEVKQEQSPEAKKEQSPEAKKEQSPEVKKEQPPDISDSEEPIEPTELGRVYLSVFPVFVLLLVVGALGNAYFKQRRETIKDYITSP